LLDDVALILVVVSVVPFFQSEDFIVGLGMVGRVLASIIGSFLLLVAVAVVVPIIATGVVGIYSLWIARVTTLGI
jgi:hypothetical protein